MRICEVGAMGGGVCISRTAFGASEILGRLTEEAEVFKRKGRERESHNTTA